MTPSRERFLFICTGNTCRSPMAELFFMRLCREAGLPWTAASAGTLAADGMALSQGASAVFAKRGFAPVAHRARRVDAEMLKAAGAVYVMERYHRDFLAAEYPAHASRIFVLREAAGLTPGDVDDPAGADASEYETCAAAIEEALAIIVRKERELHV